MSVIPADWSSHPFCYVTSTGRRSGRPHRIEIWFVVDGGDAWLLTERDPETDWVRNLRASPAVTLEIAGIAHECRAAVVEIAPDHRVRSALATRYEPSGGELLDWARGALAVRVRPVGRADGDRGATTR